MEEYIKQLKAKLIEFEAELKKLKHAEAPHENIMYCQGQVGTFYFCLQLAKTLNKKS